MNTKRDVLVSKNNKAIHKNNQKCIKCGYCINACQSMDVLNRCKNLEELKELCINCGRCTLVCPVEAIREKYNYQKVLKILASKKKVKVVSIAPAVRVAFEEEFGGFSNENKEGILVGILKELGFDYVFDIASGADLVIVEEAKELQNRIKNNEHLPMFSSCCPAFIKYVEEFEPELIPNLSTCKSPIAMFGTIIKTYFKEKIKVRASDIINVVIAPCTAKKEEITRRELNIAGVFENELGIHDTDYVLTTRELAILVKKQHINLKKIKAKEFDNPILAGSKAGLLFGSSGGVSESLIRTLYYDIKHKNLSKDKLVIKELRGSSNVKEYQAESLNLKVCAVSGLSNAKKILEKVKSGECDSTFIEVMACPMGCINGGGQPKMTMLNKNKTLKLRMQGILNADLSSNNRLCHENLFIKELYANFLDSPGSSKAYKLLHRTYLDKNTRSENEKD